MPNRCLRLAAAIVALTCASSGSLLSRPAREAGSLPPASQPATFATARYGAPPGYVVHRENIVDSISVDPSGGTAYTSLGRGAQTQVFTVWNAGTTAATYSLAAVCTGAASGCSASASSVTLAPSAGVQVTVTYTALAAGTGTVQLAATQIGGSGRTTTGTMDVVVENRVRLTYLSRGLCLTLSVPGGASECGDLRLVHALPGVQTLNQARMPVLVYNTAVADPRLQIVYTASMSPSKPAADSLSIVVTLSTGLVLPRQSWPGWPVGESRRLLYAATPDLATGVYTASLQLTAWRGGVPSSSTTPVEFAWVNRSRSAFGAGWWVAGLEELDPLADERKLWVGGDGSATVYTPVNDTTWVAPNPERPDTLKKRMNGAAARWIRLLPGGAHVVFGAGRWQDSTVTRFGRITTFSYGTNGLETVTVAGGALYRFEYGTVGTAPARLWRVTLESDTLRRVVELGPQDGDGRIRTIRDPDGVQEEFEYACCDAAQRRITRRKDPASGTWTAYEYDGVGKLVVASHDMGAAGTADDIVYRITPGESRGATGQPARTDSVYTLLDGPRADTDVRDYARFWLQPRDATSIPERIVDALGNETVLTRGDSRFPGLVTRMDGPVQAGGGRFSSTAVYDARGNLAASTSANPLGDGRDATTRYTRGDPRWPDFVTRVTLPLGQVTEIGYDRDRLRRARQPRLAAGRARAGQPRGLPLLHGRDGRRAGQGCRRTAHTARQRGL